MFPRLLLRGWPGLCVGLAILAGFLPHVVAGVTETGPYRAGVAFDGPLFQVQHDGGDRRLLISDSRRVWSLDWRSPPPTSKRLAEIPLGAEAASRLLTIAPGGGLIAAVTGGKGIELFDGHGKRLAVLDRPPPRVESINVFLGHRGRSILTGIPMESLTGIEGKWDWSFWSRQGRRLGRFEGDIHTVPYLDPGGDRVAIVTPRGLDMYDASGRQVRSIGGRFGAVALSERAKVLLLGGPFGSEEVAIYSGAHPTPVHAGSPVWGLAVSPNGRHGLIWSPGGVIRELDTLTGRVGPPIQAPDGLDAAVTSALVGDDGRATAGLIFKSGGSNAYNAAMVLQIQDGGLLWSRHFDTTVVTALVPGVLPLNDAEVAVSNHEGLSLLRYAPGETSGRGR